MLTRGSHVRFLPERGGLVVQKAGNRQGFWWLDLQTGHERQLADFAPGFGIGEFDVSADGREIVFDRLKETSDIVLITRPRP